MDETDQETSPWYRSGPSSAAADEGPRVRVLTLNAPSMSRVDWVDRRDYCLFGFVSPVLEELRAGT